MRSAGWAEQNLALLAQGGKGPFGIQEVRIVWMVDCPTFAALYHYHPEVGVKLIYVQRAASSLRPHEECRPGKP
eukprot:scaffold7462_cov430-Prasinococcus_capsulatus_cf.AAC.6